MGVNLRLHNVGPGFFGVYFILTEIWFDFQSVIISNNRAVYSARKIEDAIMGVFLSKPICD